MSDEGLMEMINHRIFDDQSSCWNVDPRTRPLHLLLVGGSRGRILVHSQSGPHPLRLFTSWWDRLRFSVVPKSWRPKTRAEKWFEHKFIFADSWSDSWIKHKRGGAVVTVSHGFTSLLSDWSRNSESVQFLRSRITTFDSVLGPNELPEVTIKSDFGEWKQRKFNLFLMGQADDREAYSLRTMALEQIPAEHNVLIQTSNGAGYSEIWKYAECKGEGDDGLIHSFPCSMKRSTEIYVGHLMQSRFNLMFGGDDPCSSRFYDGLAFNAINIVISDGFDGCIIGRGLMTEQQRNMLFHFRRIRVVLLEAFTKSECG